MASEPLTLTVIGCGNMGRAILGGILSALETLSSGTSTPSTLSTPKRLPSRFVCCVKRDVSATRVAEELNSPSKVTVLTGKNVEGAKLGDIILLGCKPQMAKEILAEEGMREAIEGKLLISILAGTKLEQLVELVPESTRVVRAMPNTASKIRESMTVICAPESLPPQETELVGWIFSQIGRALFLSEKHMDACTALCASGPAFYALILEAMADGGVMMGLPRAEAQMMAAMTMQGAARMILAGQHPAVLREQVSTPAGCTIGGLLALEDGKVRSTVARAIEETTKIAAGLGKK